MQNFWDTSYICAFNKLYKQRDTLEDNCHRSPFNAPLAITKYRWFIPRRCTRSSIIYEPIIVNTRLRTYGLTRRRVCVLSLLRNKNARCRTRICVSPLIVRKIVRGARVPR